MCTWSCSVKKIVVSCLETAKFSSRGSAPHPAGGSAPDPGWAWGFAPAPRPLPPLFTTGNYLMHLFVAAPVRITQDTRGPPAFHDDASSRLP